MDVYALYWHPLFFGAASLFIASLLFFLLYRLHSERYYVIQMQPHRISVDQTLLQTTLQHSFKELFPQKSISFDLNVNGKEIEIKALFPPVPLAEQSRFLEKVEKELAERLSFLLDHSTTFTLFATFS